MSERRYVPDSWTPHELPALIAIAEWDEANTSPMPLRMEVLADRMGRPRDDVPRIAKAVGRLVDAGYVDAQSLAYMGAQSTDYMIRRLTPLGLQAVGAWPRHGDDLVTLLLRAMESEADILETTHAEDASRLKAVAKFLGTQGIDVAKAIAAAVVTHGITGA